MQQDAEELYSAVVNTLAQSLKEVGFCISTFLAGSINLLGLLSWCWWFSSLLSHYDRLIHLNVLDLIRIWIRLVIGLDYFGYI